MKKTIIGVVLFLLQMGLALFYNQSIDLIYVAGISVIIFIYILISQRRSLSGNDGSLSQS